MTRITLTIIIFAIIASLFPVFAQADNRDEVMRRIEMLRIWRLTEILNLDPAHATKIFPTLSRYDKHFRQMGQEKDRLLGALKTELKKENPDSAKLSNISAEIFLIEKEAMEIREKMFDELKDIFTPEQMAKYIIFEIKFQKEMEEIIHKVRRDRARTGTMKIKTKNKNDK